MKLVGRYQIQARIGQGAMANVYRAYDPSINRELAIKVLKREYCRNPEFAARFLREARAAGALSHPNIVTIYDVGEIQGFPYIAMELLDGKPLDKAAHERGQFAVADVMNIGAQLAEALRYAHGLGIVHRDIKPSNIMISKDGRSVKILDFGIARVADAEGQGEEVLKTHVGQVLGTPRYMSPEQALGRAMDGRSDLFSVGVVLYELITGRAAFNGSSAATLALQITQLDPAPIDVTPECPKGLKFIVSKLLSKRPEQRFASGAALFDALNRERLVLEAAAEAGKRRFSLPVRVGLAITTITAVALAAGIGAVLDRQYKAMEQVAITSGSSIVSFVASNAALPAAENSVLPEQERDWLPVQAFINSASNDVNVANMQVVDHEGVVRAASDPQLVGARYFPPRARRIIHTDSGVAVASVRAANGTQSFRFSQPIMYAGHPVGFVDVSVRKTGLQSAATLSQGLLVGLGVLMVGLVGFLSIAAARLVLNPVRSLKTAMLDAASGKHDFRISHRRHDEFGELFDAFNALMDVRSGPSQAPANLDATMIASAPAQPREEGAAA
ncbi:protein kinase domain-containing protein [Terricaulis sp.]|uniref:serine/threonine-protein kinase n=1 Tax=Terricaulis sp. TaxID=2768686 RepID=UPI0037833675